MEFPQIKTIEEKIVIGCKSSMAYGETSKIISLWRQFMPQSATIPDRVPGVHIAVQNYSDFGNFEAVFDIWATVEVTTITEGINGMQSLLIHKGDYAVFTLSGMDIGGLYRQIMSEWLPTSGYQIDQRPHFQLMDHRYKNGSPDSEEDVYIPIKPA